MTTTVHDAEPGDVYADAQGKLWRIIGIWGEPTVIAQEIESASPESPVQQHGGVSGLMWGGWKRILRTEPDTKAGEMFQGHDRKRFCV